MSNSDQAEYWTGQTGWVEQQEKLDATMAPILDLLFDRAALTSGERVLDIGCGTGAATLTAADQVGSDGHVTGADISPTLLARARERATDKQNISLTEADMQTYVFDDPFDVVISRFGVMFFENTVAAFKNILRSIKPGGRIIMASWGPAPQNPWFKIPAEVATARMGEAPKVDPTQPGPFAFQDKDRVIGMLTKAGVEHPRCEAVTVHMTAGTAMQAATLCTNVGGAKRVISHFNGTEDDRIAVRDGIAEAFAKYETSEGLKVPALINLYTGHAPD